MGSSPLDGNQVSSLNRESGYKLTSIYLDMKFIAGHQSLSWSLDPYSDHALLSFLGPGDSEASIIFTE